MESKPDAGQPVTGGGTGALYGVLVTYRRPRDVEVFLDRLAHQTVSLAEVVVVDNDDDPAVRAIALDSPRPFRVSYLPLPENGGPAGAIAAGMGHFLGTAGDDDWVVLFDDDDPPASDTLLEDLLGFAEETKTSRPSLGAVGVAGAVLDWRRVRLREPADERRSGPVPVDCISGSGFPMYRAGAIRTVGPVEPSLFFGFDDLYYGLLLKDAGYEVVLDGDRMVPTFKGGNAAPWRRYYGVRNLVWMLRRRGNVRAAVQAAVLYGVIASLAAAVRRDDDAAQRLRLGLRACVDGWTGRLGRTIEPT